MSFKRSQLEKEAETLRAQIITINDQLGENANENNIQNTELENRKETIFRLLDAKNNEIEELDESDFIDATANPFLTPDPTSFEATPYSGESTDDRDDGPPQLAA